MGRVFAGLRRKGGDPMVWHSVRVGRLVSKRGGDAVCTFAGYAHDTLEDTDVDERRLLDVAAQVLGDRDLAREAVLLVRECSYSEHECAMSRDERKASACARWTDTEDSRVHLVKACDVDDNARDMKGSPPGFREGYLTWAAPFRENLGRRLHEAGIMPAMYDDAAIVLVP